MDIAEAALLRTLHKAEIATLFSVKTTPSTSEVNLHGGRHEVKRARHRDNGARPRVILLAMWIHRVGSLLFGIAGLWCLWCGVRAIVKAAWRELSAYMRNQRFGE